MELSCSLKGASESSSSHDDVDDEEEDDEDEECEGEVLPVPVAAGFLAAA